MTEPGSAEVGSARARQVWTGLAGVPVSFPSSGVEVVVAPRSWLCPAGWSGVVVLGGAGISTVPSDDLVEVVRRVLSGLPIEAATDPEHLRAGLPIAETLGPATLAYLTPADFRPARGAVSVLAPAAPGPSASGPSAPGPSALSHFLGSVDEEDAGESGLAEITSAAFVVRDGGDVVAAAGYRAWPGTAAHLGVLTAPSHRGRGLAQIVASAAADDALRHGLLPQWRARPAASRRVARALGFRELGAQLSFRAELTHP